jgi:Mrp family chromosome partitioning ATPase
VSLGEAEGQSTIAAATALTTAGFGHDLVAVDTDMRHPELHARLGQQFGEGVAEVARRDVNRLMVPTGYQHLWLVAAGIPDRHPADVLSVNLSVVLEAARGRNRRVVIDCPPLHGLAETMIVLAAARNALLVVDARKAKVPELEAAVAQLRGAGVNLLGIVVNRAAAVRRRGSYAAYRAPTPSATRRPPATRPAGKAAVRNGQPVRRPARGRRR